MSDLQTPAIFQTTDTSLAQRNGAKVQVLRTITEPDATHDADVLPMYVIQFADGSTAEAWRDELVAA